MEGVDAVVGHLEEDLERDVDVHQAQVLQPLERLWRGQGVRVLSLVASDLAIPPLVPSCHAHPARLPPAQSESGKQQYLSNIITENQSLGANG